MKRRLTIHIDANQVTCGECEHRRFNLCQLFNVRGLEWQAVKGTGAQCLVPRRCAPCLAAEVRE